VRTHFDLGLGTGVVVANPIPEEDEMPRELYETTLTKALADASDRGIVGRDVTPFLLERMRELTSGESVAVNLALLRHNARVAAALAGAMTHLR
jgi:pseudouridine-5'-phosphate glycosidase